MSLMAFQVGEWKYDENSEHCRVLSKACRLRCIEYGLSRRDIGAMWEVWLTFVLDGEEFTARAESRWFPDHRFLNAFLNKVAVAGNVRGMSAESKDRCLQILGSL